MDIVTVVVGLPDVARHVRRVTGPVLEGDVDELDRLSAEMTERPCVILLASPAAKTREWMAGHVPEGRLFLQLHSPALPLDQPAVPGTRDLPLPATMAEIFDEFGMTVDPVAEDLIVNPDGSVTALVSLPDTSPAGVDASLSRYAADRDFDWGPDKRLVLFGRPSGSEDQVSSAEPDGRPGAAAAAETQSGAGETAVVPAGAGPLHRRPAGSRTRSALVAAVAALASTTGVFSYLALRSDNAAQHWRHLYTQQQQAPPLVVSRTRPVTK